MPATSMHVLLIVGTARMIKELASAVLSHVSGSCCFVLMRNGIIVDSSCFVLLTDSIVAGTLPRRILQRFRWRGDGQRAICIHDAVQLDPAVCSFAGNCTVAQRPKAGQYCAEYVGHSLWWASQQAPVCHASIFLWHCDSVLRLNCFVSFRSMLFHLEFFCILIFWLLSTSVVQEVQLRNTLILLWTVM